ncbi:Tetratricopeptide repeat protein 28 [Planktothrix tepida]|uniref:tetratricopeptide repeat protein n=1 Tax=Planktothrix tepida TaxID=1678309 RepID=UPI0020B3494B|nr:tetratricopeptide repeat protein [Planktothrix tepida]CAD5978635.1 Tetratricopeptide repeat protein 28 [Planktothrix tepida]
MPIHDLVSKRNLRLLTFGAIFAGGVACPLIPALQGIGFLQAVSSISSGVAGNIFAGDLGAIVSSLGQQDILSNNDLTKAVGLAVGLLLESIATSEQYRSSRKDLKKLAKAAPKKWLELAEANRNGEINIIDPIQEEELVNLFSQTNTDFFNQQPLTPADWKSLLKDWLCPEVGITLPEEVITGVAQILAEKFPKALREVLKQDAEQGGKAFAGLMLSLLGQILATLRDHPQQTANLEPIQAGLAEIERLQNDHTEQFKQLGTEMESGFDAVLQQLGITQAQIQELRGWLSEELQILQEMLIAIAQVSQQNQELKQIAEQGFETIIGFLEQGQSKIQPISFSLNTTPPAVNYWQGREQDLAIVNGWLDDENNKLGVIVAIAGMGKSTLAAKVFNDRTDFVDKLWLDLSQRPLFSIVAQGILTQFGKLSPDQLKEIEETRLIEVLIHCLQQQRFLLVLDNLESVLQDEGYQNFLQHWLGKCHQTEILVTTQVVPNLVQDKPTELALEGLSATEGRQLLQNLDIGGTEAELGAFVAGVNGHPLTLRLVAGLLNGEIGEGATIGDLASLGIADVGELMGRLQGFHRQEAVQLVAVLDASFNHLSEKLQRVLLSLVVLRGGFDGVTATAISGETVTDKELRELGKRGFLASETKGVYTFLPLILEYLKYRVGDLRGAHLKAIQFYLSRFKSRDQWQTVEDVREYLEVFYHWCELGEYKAAFDVIQDGDNVNNFLNLRGNNQLLAELYQELVEHLTDKQDWLYTASLTSLGNIYNSLGRYKEAISYCQQSLEIYREIGDRGGEASSLCNLGIAYNCLGRYEDAISYHQQSLEIDREIGDRDGIAGSLCNLGNVYNFLGRYEEAISYYQQSLDIQPEIRNRLWEANSLNNLGNAYNCLGRYEDAISYHQQSLEIDREIGNRRGIANSLGNLGNVYNSLGRYEDAISYHQQSLEIYREIGDRQGVAVYLNNLGNAHNSLGRYEEAISYHQQSLDIRREMGDRGGVAYSLNGLGIAYNSLGRYEEAISYCQQSLEIYREIGDREGVAASLGNLGIAYNSLRQYEEAISYYQQSLEIYREIGDRGGEASSLCNLGIAYNCLGRYEDAISYHQQSLEIRREIGNRRGEADSLYNLGNDYNSLGRYEEAISCYQQSLEIRREIGNRGGEADSLYNLGSAYNYLGCYEEAISCYQQSLEIRREIGNRGGEADSLYNLGNDYNSLGRYEEAISCYQQSLEIYREIEDRQAIAISLFYLGNAYNSLGRYEDAISYLQQSLEIQREIGDRREVADSLLVLGNLYHKTGRIKEGFAASQQAQLIYQELDLSLDANPSYPNWMKKIAKFAQRNKFNLILCFIIGVFAFPFALIWIILLMLYGIIRSRFPHR